MTKRSETKENYIKDYAVLYFNINFYSVNTMPKINFTEETRDQIIHNIINDSTSKVSWTFSKDPRFKTQKKQCPHIAYDIALSTNNMRKTNFGYGKRTQFILNNQFVPSPFNYSLAGEFQTKQKKGKSFGVGRQKTEPLSYIPLENLKVPGPGQYVKQQPKNNSKGFSMRPKTPQNRNYFIDDKEQKSNPGPGRYQVQSKMVGKSSLTKFKSALTPNLLNSTSSRWTKCNTNPGPGNYLQKVQQYVLSIHRQDQAKSIPKESRISFTEQRAQNSFAPGPGTYKQPSDFGHYKRIRTEHN